MRTVMEPPQAILETDHVAPGARPHRPLAPGDDHQPPAGPRGATLRPGTEIDGRVVEAAVHPLFVERWSPRAFSPQPLSHQDIETLLEAARWAPSSNNEQPWHFVYALNEEDRQRFATFLNGFNQQWAPKAPALLVLLARTESSRGGPNPFADFDAGAAWMSLTLQARLLGLHTHAMGGIDRDKAREVLGVPPDYRVLAAIAVGRRGDAFRLPEALAKRERPSPRKPLSAVASEAVFTPERSEQNG